MVQKSYNLKHTAQKTCPNDDGNVETAKSTDEDDATVAGGESGESGDRGQWSKGLEFLFSCISLSVGLGNIWRFPYVAYENGGGAFLIPYLLLLFVIGRPLYYMELVLGQFGGKGPLKVWTCVPAFKGIAFAQICSTLYLIIFYNYLMSLTLYYLAASFKSPLPWTECDSSWGGCGEPTGMNSSSLNGSLSNASESTQSLSSQYFTNNVLNKSSGLEDVSSISWRLVLCLFVSWIIVFVCIAKGVQSLGKVAYFTGIFPYVVLISLLIATLFNEGAVDGILFFLTPKWDRLWDPIVWYKAVEQSFFSLGVCSGQILMYSSYNNFKNNVYKDAIIVSILDTFTSLLAGGVIFAILGSMALKQGKDIENVLGNSADQGLVFVVYAEGLSNLKFAPQVWSIMFFTMFYTLGLGTAVAQVEVILTSFRDQYTSLMKHKSLVALVACFIFFLCGLPLTTNAGMYMMTILNNYGVGSALFLYGILEIIGVAWIYGVRQFSSDIRFMLDKPVGLYWKITWGFISPVALIGIFIYGNVETFSEGGREEPGIPNWGHALGFAFAVIALFQVPLWMAITVHQKPGSSRQKIKAAFSPHSTWGPSGEFYFKRWKKFNETHCSSSQPTYTFKAVTAFD